jgi:hypothetical protein
MSDHEVEVTELSPEELVNMLRNPSMLWGTAAGDGGECALMQKVAKLPENARAALEVVMGDRSVKNPDITIFLKKFGVNVHTSEVQRHRHLKRGCMVCGTEAPQ